MKKPSALLFDMDGVLVDSLDSWYLSVNDALQAFHVPQITREEFIRVFWGHDLFDNLHRMGLDYRIGTFCNTVYGNHVDAIKIYPDTTTTLQILHHYKKGIITNTPMECAIHILNKFDIKQFFNVIVTSDQVHKSKPDPEIVFKACELLRVDPSTVIVIGDTDSDVKAGKRAGCTVVGVNIKADYTIHHLSELQTILRDIERTS